MEVRIHRDQQTNGLRLLRAFLRRMSVAEATVAVRIWHARSARAQTYGPTGELLAEVARVMTMVRVYKIQIKLLEKGSKVLNVVKA